MWIEGPCEGAPGAWVPNPGLYGGEQHSGVVGGGAGLKL